MSEGKYRKKESEVSFPAKRQSSNKTSNEGQANSFIYEKQVCLNDERVNEDKTNAKDVIGLNQTDVKVSVNGNGEDDRFYDTASEHAGEEQVDIGLKVNGKKGEKTIPATYLPLLFSPEIIHSKLYRLIMQYIF